MSYIIKTNYGGGKNYNVLTLDSIEGEQPRTFETFEEASLHLQRIMIRLNLF